MPLLSSLSPLRPRKIFAFDGYESISHSTIIIRIQLFTFKKMATVENCSLADRMDRVYEKVENFLCSSDDP